MEQSIGLVLIFFHLKCRNLNSVSQCKTIFSLTMLARDKSVLHPVDVDDPSFQFHERSAIVGPLTNEPTFLRSVNISAYLARILVSFDASAISRVAISSAARFIGDTRRAFLALSSPTTRERDPIIFVRDDCREL